MLGGRRHRRRVRQRLALFGSNVTIVVKPHRGSSRPRTRFAPKAPSAPSQTGIRFSTYVRFSVVTRDANGVTVTLEDGTTLTADLLLVAVGRGPAARATASKSKALRWIIGFVLTDDRLRTNVPGIYAVGDIVPGLQLAHRGFAQGFSWPRTSPELPPPALDEAAIPGSPTNLRSPASAYRGPGQGTVRR